MNYSRLAPNTQVTAKRERQFFRIEVYKYGERTATEWATTSTAARTRVDAIHNSIMAQG